MATLSVKNPPHFLRALASRNYRLYISGQWVSLLGNWMTATASMWLVYHLSGSPLAVGVVVFANQIPILILAPLAGVLVDRTDGLRVMRTTQALAMLQSAAMAVFTLSGHMTVAVLIVLSIVQGLINAFDFPSRQALVYGLAGDRALLENVIALNSITFNLARLVGPAIAGFVIAGFGAGACFAVDAVAYLAVLWALMAVRIEPRTEPASQAHPLEDLREGVSYAMNHPSIRRMLLMVPVIALVGFTHSVLAPVFAKDIFHGDARTLGLLLSATGAGSLVAGGFMSGRTSSTGLGRLVAIGSLICGLSLAGIGLSPGLTLGTTAYAAAGLGSVLVMIAGNTWVQMLVEDDKRGRVMSLFQMGASFYPIGGLIAGALAEGLGPRVAIIICGGSCSVAALVFAWSLKKPDAPEGVGGVLAPAE